MEIVQRVRAAGYEVWDTPQILDTIVMLKDCGFVRVTETSVEEISGAELSRVRLQFQKKASEAYYASLRKYARYDPRTTWAGWAENQDRAYPLEDY